jgi:oxygen-independent coproporphyrinogen-3 oxidase
VRTPDRYIELVGSGDSVEAAAETLDAPTREFERLELMLRMRDGVPLDALDGDALPGLVERHDDRWVLTRSGRLMANAISLHLH